MLVFEALYWASDFISACQEPTPFPGAEVAGDPQYTEDIPAKQMREAFRAPPLFKYTLSEILEIRSQSYFIYWELIVEQQ